MGEIPWQNIALCRLMEAARAHPAWGVMDYSLAASDAERHAVNRGAALVEDADVRAAVAAYTPPA